MKNLIFLAVLGVAGYSVYLYFISSSQQDSTPAEPTTNEYLPPFPEECQEKGEFLEDAIYNNEMGKLTITELKRYTSRFQSCLRDAGFTDSQINRAHDCIKWGALGRESGD